MILSDIARDIKKFIRFQRDEIRALQHALEKYLIERFEKEIRAARHAGHITVQFEDIGLGNDLLRQSLFDNSLFKPTFLYQSCKQF